jgi:hypothetical protein
MDSPFCYHHDGTCFGSCNIMRKGIPSVCKAAIWSAVLALIALPGRTASAQGTPGFTEVTAAAGVTFVYGPNPDTPNGAQPGGGTEGDFNGDGWPDLFLVGGGLITDALFINQGDGTFLDTAATAGFTQKYRGIGANAADYDDDGDLDIYATSFGNVPGPVANGQQKLWNNAGDGTFTNVAVTAGVNSTGSSFDGFGANWGDYDLDGDLDLFVAGWFPVAAGQKDNNRVFRNNLSETGIADFTDVTIALGLFTPGSVTRGFGGIFADMDGDHWPELLVAADFGTSKYFKNNGGVSFTSQWPMAPGDTKVYNGMGTCVGDFNRDQLLDWFVTAIYPASLALGPDGNRLYMNLGAGQIQSLPDSAGVNDGGWGWGAAPIDFDQDGWQDLVQTNGMWYCDTVTGECFAPEPTYLFHNNGDQTFTEQHVALNFIHDYAGRGVIVFDYDRDGDMDVVITSNPKKGVSDPPETGNLALYRNEICTAGVPADGANFLEVALDTSADADLAPHGLGADVRVKTGSIEQRVNINGGSNYLSRSQLIAHFGLGSAPVVDQITVTWPNGDTSVLAGVAANQSLTVSSSALTWELLGFAKAGSNGLPSLTGSGPLSAGSLDQLDLTSAAPSSAATLVFGLAALNVAFKGGTLVPSPTLLVALPTSPVGSTSLPFLFPPGVPPGISLFFQFWISDPGATKGLSASNGIRGVTS